MRRARPAARPAARGLSEPLARGDWLRGRRAGGRLPALGTGSRAGGSGFAPGTRMKAFLVGKRKGRRRGAAETKAGGGGARAPAARSPGSSRAAVGDDAGGGGPVRRAQDPDPALRGHLRGASRGGRAWARPPQHCGRRGSGDEEPLSPSSGLGTRCPDLRTRSAAGNLACVGAPGLAPAPPLRSQELPPLLAPGLETQNPESSLGFHPGSDTPKPGVLGENLARLPAAPHLCSVRAEEPWGPPALQALCVPSSLRPQPASHIAPAATALRRRHRARAGHRPGLRKTLTRGFQAPSAAGTRGWGHAGWKPGEGTQRGDPLVSSADPSRAFRGSGAQGELLGRRGGFLLHQAPPGVAGHHTEGT